MITQVYPHRAVIPVIITLITITIILNSQYRQQLYTMGQHIILRMQKMQNFYLDWFFMIITMTIDPAFVFIGIIAMVVASHRKGKGYIIFCFILINTFFAALIKAYHCDPRPIWTQDTIRNIGLYCPIQYGNPSGHSWFSVIAGFGVLIEYRGAGAKYRNIFISILLLILVPISRMYLGAHSLNQVLQGLIFGIFFCLWYIINLKDILHKFLAQFNHDKKWKLVIICLHILSIIPFIIHMDQELPVNWLQNINKKCIKNMNEARLNQLMLTVNALIINVLTGLGLGYEQLVKSPIGAYYLTGRWVINREKYGEVFGWVLYILLEVWFMLCGLILAGILFKLHPTFVTGYIGLSIGGLVSGYIFTTRTAKYLHKYSIIKRCEIKDKEMKDRLRRQLTLRKQNQDRLMKELQQKDKAKQMRRLSLRDSKQINKLGKQDVKGNKKE